MPAPNPVADATVRITGIWPTLSPPDVSPSDADKPNFVSLCASLYSQRDGLAAQAYKQNDFCSPPIAI
jgi:hypothetical protein